MRSVFLLFAAAGLSAEAPPSHPIDRFNRALADSNYNDAAAVVDELIAARTPEGGKPRQDALLNALIGRLYLAAHQPDAAGIYLDHAPVADLPNDLRAETALAHGHALDLRGDRAGALTAFREAAATSTNETQARRAAIGAAEQQLPDDPVAASRQVLPIAQGPQTPQRWEANYLLALASSILGDRAAAAKFATAAWADVPAGNLSDLALLHVATLRAGLAASRNDPADERAMLTASNGLSVTAAPSLSNSLPVCGDFGLKPDDFVIFGFVSGPYATRELFPIAASRLEAIAPFQAALGGTAPVKGPNAYAPIGTVFRVSCRTAVNANYSARHGPADPLLEWFVEHGLYPGSSINNADDKHLNAVIGRTDKLAARFGANSPLLIEPKWQTMNLLEQRARGGDQVLPGQLSDLGRQVARGLRLAGAPEWMAQVMESRLADEQAVAAAQNDPSELSTAQERFRDQLLRVPFHASREVLGLELSNVQGDWPAAVANMVVALNANVPKNLTLRERQSWAMTLAEAQRVLGKDKAAQATLASAGVPKDLCLAADSDVSLLDQHFSYDDYPDELIAGEQEGSVMFDFDLSATGSLAAHRIVYSLPSGLFDQASARGLATVRYTPAKRDGKAVACRGVYQPIVWRLEGEQDFAVPTLTPESVGPIS